MTSRIDNIKTRLHGGGAGGESGDSRSDVGYHIVFWVIACLMTAILFVPENPLMRFSQNMAAPEDYFARVDFTFSPTGEARQVFSAGTRLVSKNQLVTPIEYRKLVSENEEWSNQYGGLSGYATRAISLIFIVIISIALFALFLARLRPENFNAKKMLALGSLFAAAVLCGKLLSLFLSSSLWMFAPVAMVSIICGIAFGETIAAMAAAFSFPILVFACWPAIHIPLAITCGAVIAPFIAAKVRKRAHLLRAGLIIGMIHFLVILSVGLFGNMSLPEVTVLGLVGLLSGLATGAAVTFLMPIIEWLFGVVTDISLIELSDLNHPLLKEMLLKSSGTYQHSLLVATLSENAAEAIGANALMCKVGSLFHDIGKMLRPQYFVENNPDSAELHARLKPSLSAMLIISHTKDGAELAHEYDLPQPIVDIIEQHQGTTLVEYFYKKATGVGGTLEEPDRQLFQYPGPRPLSREAAIVMIADTVEAASRTLRNPSPKRIEEMVHALVQKKLNDGQFNTCSITMAELHTVEHRLSYMLQSMFHQRIEYTVPTIGEKPSQGALSEFVKDG
ncbi:MAG: HDIG domain-containing metalloprotein [Candidatus Brocadiia bacterium]